MTESKTTRPRMVTIGYVVLILTTAIGVWALGVRFSRDLIVTNLTQHVPWSLWIVFYIYFIGLSAGSFYFRRWSTSLGSSAWSRSVRWHWFKPWAVCCSVWC